MYEMKRLRRILSLSLMFAVSVAIMPGTSGSAAKLKKGAEDAQSMEAGTNSGKCGKSASFTLDNGVLTISGSGTCAGGKWDKKSVKKVIIKNGITGIGAETFQGCTELTDIEIPDSVTSISTVVFAGCDKLEKAVFGTKKKINTDRRAFEKWSGTAYFYTASGILTKSLSTSNIKYLDKNIECAFYIRKDNFQPAENGNTSYATNLYKSAGKGRIKEAKKIFSSVADVEANIETAPDVSKFLGPDQKVNWYVVKVENDGWHIDGVITSKESTVTPDKDGDITVKNVALYYDVNASDATLGDYALKDGVYEDSKKYNKGDKVTVIDQIPERKGYKFIGWNTSDKANAEHEVYKPGVTFDFPDVSTLTLYAVWQKNESKLNYDVNASDASFGEGSYKLTNGVYTDSNSYSSGDKVTLIGESPKRDGYTFVGWSEKKDETDSSKIYKGKSELVYPDTDNYTLYAIWSKNEEGSTYPAALAVICVLIVVGTYGYTRKRKNVN